MINRTVSPPPPPPSLMEKAALLLKVELLPFWLFWQNLRALRDWWPALLPALLVYGLRVYRRERLAAPNAPDHDHDESEAPAAT